MTNIAFSPLVAGSNVIQIGRVEFFLIAETQQTHKHTPPSCIHFSQLVEKDVVFVICSL